ncbi:helix-turn-helix domain-containing protein [Trueperella pyogenes]|uniref:helix-turn-helix domain-containing protein n=1 Tax=Trueperella pyogenes TaxID=1661 RepID=UPI00345CC947
MSWRASAWALDEVLGIGANAKLVLLALCEFANDDNETWRSQSEIAKRAECEERTVRTHLKSLEGWGLISRRPRYRWCESDEPACATRPAHKHRSGTTYVVHMERGVFNLAAFEVSHGSSDDGHDHGARGVDKQLVDNGAVDSQPVNRAVDNSTPAKFAGMEKTAVSSGKVHIGKLCRYEDGQGSTPANSRRPHRQESAPIRSYNPHINLQPTIQPSVEAEKSSVAGSSVGGWMDGDSSQEDVMLVRQCLPASWQPLAVGTALTAVVGLLRAGMEAGWTPAGIERALGWGPTLDRATNPAGLMIYRVRRLVASPPPVSDRELRAARRQAREREIKTRLESILANPESDPGRDWMFVMQLGVHGLSQELRDLHEQAHERVRQRQERWNHTHYKITT